MNDSKLDVEETVSCWSDNSVPLSCSGLSDAKLGYMIAANWFHWEKLRGFSLSSLHGPKVITFTSMGEDLSPPKLKVE